MITEDYCSFELSKLLKEKGFDCDCKGYDAVTGVTTIHNWKSVDGLTPCCTHQLAMKWLREVHNKYCDIGYDYYLNWFFQIIDLKETTHYDYTDAKYYHAENEFDFNSYREAVEAALKYSLENLI